MLAKKCMVLINHVGKKRQSSSILTMEIEIKFWINHLGEQWRSTFMRMMGMENMVLINHLEEAVFR